MTRMTEALYKITPTTKPRMTQRDKWLRPPRPCVQRYWAFCDEVRGCGVCLPESGASITFLVPMPKSWSKKKRAEYEGKKHQQTPDLSNLLKALEDAVHTNDAHIWQYSGLRKIWAKEGGIKIINENT